MSRADRIDRVPVVVAGAGPAGLVTAATLAGNGVSSLLVGGMGMNTAVVEGHDLGWKLAWVHHGWGGPGLLDTYETEWLPIGARRTARSAVANGEPDGAEALAEDLDNRLPHAWLAGGNGRPAPPSTCSAPA